MTVHGLPGPAQLRKHLHWDLPLTPTVQVIPRDTNERKCAAGRADHYELNVHYEDNQRPLDDLEAAIQAIPGVYRTTRLVIRLLGDPGLPSRPAVMHIEDPDWPVKYRDLPWRRVQVLALIRDPSPPKGTQQ